MKRLLLVLFCLSISAFAQAVPEGVGQGYDGELKHVTSQLIALAEATSPEKSGWSLETEGQTEFVVLGSQAID